MVGVHQGALPAGRSGSGGAQVRSEAVQAAQVVGEGDQRPLGRRAGPATQPEGAEPERCLDNPEDGFDGLLPQFVAGALGCVREEGLEALLLQRQKPGPKEGTWRGVQPEVIAALAERLGANQFASAEAARRRPQEIGRASCRERVSPYV